MSSPALETVLSPEIAAVAWDLEGDEILRRRADCQIGNVAAAESLEIKPVVESRDQIVSLSEAIHKAREGSVEALALVRANVTTDYFERAYKTGFVSEVELTKSADGKLIQNGQTLESVHANSLMHLSDERLRERSRIEALNAVRDQHYTDNGVFKDYARLVISAVHDQMNDKEAESVGFFTHTRSLSIQLMTEREGKVIIQSAFVAGRENLSSPVFDIDAVVRFAKKLNLDFSGLGSEGILASPIIVHKKHLPDLVLSAVQLFDEAAAEVTARPKFFGRDTDAPSKATQDYLDKFQESKTALERMQSDITGVVSSLLTANPSSPTAATSKLAELNDLLLKSRIVEDMTIDSRVLGTKVAYYVDHARYLHENNMRLYEISWLQNRINKEGGSSSCPGGAQAGVDSLDALGDPFGNLDGQKQPEKTEDSTPEDCEFVSKECPKCGAKDVLTTCKNGKYYGACGCHT